jgi:hypothetical protein
MVEGAYLIGAAAARAKRIEQDSAQRRVVEGVRVLTLGRFRAAPVPLITRTVEAVKRRADCRATTVGQRFRDLVSEERLASGVRAIDGDPKRMVNAPALHQVR